MLNGTMRFEEVGTVHAFVQVYLYFYSICKNKKTEKRSLAGADNTAEVLSIDTHRTSELVLRKKKSIF
jgi:hypothetical protein